MSNSNKPTHNVTVVKSTFVNDKDETVENRTTVGVAWQVDTAIGQVTNIKLDFPIGCTEITLFPIKEKKEK